VDTPLIINIRAKRLEIKDVLKKVRTHDFGSTKFGTESEFTSKSVIVGIEAILVDIDALCGAPAKFLKNSTGQERGNLSTLLSQLLNHCTNLDLINAVSVLEQIKPILRGFGIRSSDDRRLAFENYTDELLKKSQTLTAEIEKLREVKLATETELEEMTISLRDAKEKVSHIEEVSESINEQLEASNVAITKMAEIQAGAESVLAEIEELRVEADSSKLPIDEFSKKVSQREIQLESQEARTNDYREKLAQYEVDRIAILKEAKDLIDSARAALGYKTAEGLSAAFTEKYKDAKDDKSTWVWIGVAALFLLGAIAVGIWVTLDSDTAIGLVVGRLSLIPLLVAGAWFAASQYTKQRNIAEEYAYKSVLVRSMVGFSEQISGSDGKGDDYSHYVRNVLSEIHMNPLRKPAKSEKEQNSSETVDLLREIKGPLEKIIERTAKS
jgi:hypothetical protein